MGSPKSEGRSGAGRTGIAEPDPPTLDVYRTVVEDQSDPILRWSPDGTVTWMNEAYCRMLGRTEEEILGRSFFDEVPTEGHQHILEELDRLNPSEPSWTNTSPVPRNGSVSWMEWKNQGVFDDSGTLVGVQSVGRDVTERKAHEDALKESEAWFRTLIDNAPEAITLSDGETGTFLSFNDRTLALFARTREELAGASPFELSPPFQPDGRSSQEAGRDYFRRAMKGETPVFEWVHLRGDGSDVLCEIRLTKLPVPGRNLIRGSLVDMTEWKEAEREVRLTRAAVDQVADGALVLNQDGQVVYANQAICRLLEKSHADLLSGTFYDLHPDFSVGVWDQFWKELRQEGSRTILTDLKQESGPTIFLEVWISHISFDGQEYGVCTLRDRTDEKKAEEALQDSKDRLQVFTGAGFEGIAVTDAGIILDLNHQLAEMLGWDREELIGTPLMECVAEESRELVEARSRARCSEPYEPLAKKKDGSTFPVEVRGKAMPYKGKPVRVTAIRDLTRRKETEAALQRSEADFRGLVEHAPLGILRASPHGELLSANQALVQMLHYPSEEALVGVDLPEAICRNGRATRSVLRTMREGRSVEGAETEWRRLDGQEITVWLTGRPVPRADGTVECFEVIVEDVTERRKLQAQLRQAQKMEAVGQLTGGIAHDFNNLLSVILLHSEVLRDGLKGSNPVLSAAVQGVSEAAESAAGMTRKLLGLSRQADLAFAPTNLAKVTRGLSAMIRRLLPETIEIEIVGHQDSGPVRADSGAIEQMLLNLATNARDAMPGGGNLEIMVGNRLLDEAFCASRPWASPGTYVCVTVTDTGIGMDEDTKNRIFEPFFTTKPTGLGTGLGMAMVYGLIKQHDGFVDVETEVGRGTSITLCFPLLPETHLPNAAREASRMPGGSETVLLVEDEEMLRHVGKGVLGQHGYKVLVAGNGGEALAVYGDHAEDIDLIVSDVVMPQMGGFDLYEVFRGEIGAPAFLLTSGYPGRDSGGVRTLDPTLPFLEKPWKAGDLLRKVREVLDNR